MSLLLIFFAGLATDFLSGLHLRLATEKRYFTAALIGSFGIFIGYMVFIHVAEMLNAGHAHGVASYAVGAGVGNYFGLKYGVRQS